MGIDEMMSSLGEGLMIIGKNVLFSAVANLNIIID